MLAKMGLEGIVSKRLGSRYRSGRTSDWLKFKNPEVPAVQREAKNKHQFVEALPVRQKVSTRLPLLV